MRQTACNRRPKRIAQREREQEEAVPIHTRRYTRRHGLRPVAYQTAVKKTRLSVLHQGSIIFIVLLFPHVPCSRKSLLPMTRTHIPKCTYTNIIMRCCSSAVNGQKSLWRSHCATAKDRREYWAPRAVTTGDLEWGAQAGDG